MEPSHSPFSLKKMIEQKYWGKKHPHSKPTRIEPAEFFHRHFISFSGVTPRSAKLDTA